MFFRRRAEFLEIPSRFGVHIVFFVCFFQERGNGRHFLFASPKRKCLAKEKRPRKTFGCFPRTPSIDQSLALDLRRMEVGESTIDFVGADAERSCSRRRSVTDAACPLRVLIGPPPTVHHRTSCRGGRPCPPASSIFCRTSLVCRGRCRAQLFATKERYRCGLPLAGTHRPFFEPILVFLRIEKDKNGAQTSFPFLMEKEKKRMGSKNAFPANASKSFRT